VSKLAVTLHIFPNVGAVQSWWDQNYLSYAKDLQEGKIKIQYRRKYLPERIETPTELIILVIPRHPKHLQGYAPDKVIVHRSELYADDVWFEIMRFKFIGTDWVCE